MHFQLLHNSFSVKINYAMLATKDLCDKYRPVYFYSHPQLLSVKKTDGHG